MQPFWDNRTGPTVGKTITTDPGVKHLSDIHSYQPFDELWGLQTTKVLPAHQPVCGSDRGLLDRVHQLFPLLKDSHSLFSAHVVSKEMLQILYFPNADPINHGLKYWIFLLSSHSISYM